MPHFTLTMALGIVLLTIATLPAAESPGAARIPGPAAPFPSVHVQHLFRVTTNVFSGNAPETDAAFAEIAKLGVKTVISVDGGKPDVAAARRHGLRYLHLPFGYDGVPTNRVAELVAAGRSAEGPIYVHCHHGLHRGPAAVAILCEATAGWTTNQAVTWLRQAGTAADYGGLYRSAIEFRPPAPGTLPRLADLPEIARTSSIVDSMVAIDGEFDRLKAAQAAQWKNVPGQPDVVPARTAAILWEHFRELARLEDTTRRSPGYRSKLAEAEAAADRLRRALADAVAGPAPREEAFQALTRSCRACHQAHRN